MWGRDRGMEPLSTTEMTQRAGLSFRQLDFAVRERIIAPSETSHDGTGHPRRWGPEQIKVVRFMAVLREHGANAETLRQAVAEVESFTPEAWDERALVTRDGHVTSPLAEAHGWLVDLAQCRHAEQEAMAAA